MRSKLRTLALCLLACGAVGSLLLDLATRKNSAMLSFATKCSCLNHSSFQKSEGFDLYAYAGTLRLLQRRDSNLPGNGWTLRPVFADPVTKVQFQRLPESADFPHRIWYWDNQDYDAMDLRGHVRYSSGIWQVISCPILGISAVCSFLWMITKWRSEVERRHRSALLREDGQ